MQCIICGGTSFSIRASDIQKTRQEQIKNSKYGDCCCLSCALKKSQTLIAYHGYNEKKVYRYFRHRIYFKNAYVL